MDQNRTDSNSKSDSRSGEPFHYTFGCRWVGHTLDSYPPQGHKLDGHHDPAIAFRRSLKTLIRNERDQRRKKQNNDKKRQNATESDKKSQKAEKREVS